jgi:hypothetical protein
VLRFESGIRGLGCQRQAHRSVSCGTQIVGIACEVFRAPPYERCSDRIFPVAWDAGTAGRRSCRPGSSAVCERRECATVSLRWPDREHVHVRLADLMIAAPLDIGRQLRSAGVLLRSNVRPAHFTRVRCVAPDDGGANVCCRTDSRGWAEYPSCSLQVCEWRLRVAPD